MQSVCQYLLRGACQSTRFGSTTYLGQQVISLWASVPRQAEVYPCGHCTPLYTTSGAHDVGRHSVVCDGPPSTIHVSAEEP